MEKAKKPSKFVTILFTIAAVCSLMTLVLMIVGDSTSMSLTVFQAFTALLLVVGAVGNWYQYTKRYVQYEVQRKLDEEKQQSDG